MRRNKAQRVYERILELPVPVVLGIMWLTGAALAGLGVLVLYFLWLLLRTLAGT